MARQTILLKGDNNRFEEHVAAGVIKPGHFIETDASGTVVVQSSEGGICERMLATEDSLQGETIDDSYASGDPVRTRHCVPGDVVFAWIKAGETITIKEDLIAAGDGTLKAYDNVTSGVTIYDTPAKAIEAIDLSGSGAVATRIAVRIL